MDFDTNLPPRGRRFKVPTIMQMEATECGAASLGMILAYYKNYIPLEDLRVQCGVSQHGSNAAKVVAAAKRHGFVAKGVRCPTDNLHQLPFPMIILWEKHHFVVLEGIKRDIYYINDPGQGSIAMPREEFVLSFSNICLLMQPGPDFKPSGKMPPTPLQAAMTHLAGNIWDSLFIFLLSLLLVVPGLLFPFLVRFFIDDILLVDLNAVQNNNFFLLITCAVFLLSLLLTRLQQIAVNRLSIKIWLLEGAKFIFHAMRLPLRFFQQRYPGDVALRATTIEEIGALISGGPSLSLVSMLLLVLYGAAMVSISWTMSVGIFAISVIYMLVFYWTAKGLNDDYLKLGSEISQYYGVGASCLDIIETIKVDEASGYFFERISGLQANVINAQKKASLRTVIVSVLPMTATVVINLFILGYGGYLYGAGLMSAGDLMAFHMLSLSFVTPFASIIGFGSQLSEAKSSFLRIKDLMNYKPDQQYLSTSDGEERQAETQPLPAVARLTGDIEICDLTFGYDETIGPLFKNFSLTIKPKQRVAIVGRSGSGKSTLAHLICGLIYPWEGKVLLDGQPFIGIAKEVLTHSLSYVSQDIFFIDGSVRENLSLWDNNISEESMHAALHDACIEEVVNGRVGRLDSPISIDGSNFSGGERQRLEIARALSSNPSILVLDEATSALDPVVELEMENRLRRRGCTCITVAHRLSTIRDADAIIVMDRGSIVEQGSHEELISLQGLYANQLLKSGELK